jgi:hypothetical protein
MPIFDFEASLLLIYKKPGIKPPSPSGEGMGVGLMQGEIFHFHLILSNKSSGKTFRNRVQKHNHQNEQPEIQRRLGIRFIPVW